MRPPDIVDALDAIAEDLERERASRRPADRRCLRQSTPTAPSYFGSAIPLAVMQRARGWNIASGTAARTAAYWSSLARLDERTPWVPR